MQVILRILPKLTFVSSFHYYEDSDCTNGEHTNNTKADNQRQVGVFRIKKGNNKYINHIGRNKHD